MKVKEGRGEERGVKMVKASKEGGGAANFYLLTSNS